MSQNKQEKLDKSTAEIKKLLEVPVNMSDMPSSSAELWKGYQKHFGGTHNRMKASVFKKFERLYQYPKEPIVQYTPEFYEIRDLSTEYLQNIDRYKPTYIVSDEDPNVIIHELAPIFTRVVSATEYEKNLTDVTKHSQIIFHNMVTKQATPDRQKMAADLMTDHITRAQLANIEETVQTRETTERIIREFEEKKKTLQSQDMYDHHVPLQEEEDVTDFDDFQKEEDRSAAKPVFKRL